MWVRRILTAVLLLFASGLLFVAAYMAAGALPVQDLAQYWSAAHLVRQNPYSYGLVAQFEHAQGIHVDPPLVLKNPPWTIVTFLPLGFFSYRVAFGFWSLISLIVLIGCTHAVWQKLQPHTAATPLYLILLFGPAIVQLMLGQWTILVLLGVVIFLIAAEGQRDWVAGAPLGLVLGKPHVTLLFLLAVALWAVLHRRWRIFASAAIVLSGANLALELFNPHVWAQFLARTTQVVRETEIYPNLGGILHLISGIRILGLLPQLVGLVWLGFYFKKHWHHWDWWRHGTTVLLCSVVCSYYSYPYDEILAIPALLVAFARGNRRAFLLAFILTDLGFVAYLFNVAGRFGFGYMFLWWTALGWLAAFLLAQTNFLVATKRAELQ